ncbi:GNAT family N-acetyltransferase [Euzebya sp.]|uniref:GNAT family N-acetyltransferase n=1 Tax=Euzebya sp. TaxID=1971409 RepID=UPI003513694E
MTTTPARATAQRLRPDDVPRVTAALESDFGRLGAGMWDPRHHYLLDALDRGEVDRFVVFGDDRPRAVVHLGLTGTVVPAGDPAAAEALAPSIDRARWRILIGDEPLARALVEASSRSWWRRRPSTRVQRLMTTDAAGVAPGAPIEGFRRASRADLDLLEDFACRLHVEDRMGPPLVGGARQGVRHRMAESVDRGMTWVVQRHGRPVAKVDLSLHSLRRGAQIAGVYVQRDVRGRGIATGMIATLARELLDGGLPVVSLHVRDDNVAAIAAYRRAGFTERGNWILALR